MPLYDIHLQLKDPSEQAYGANFTFGFRSSIKIEGKYKLANRWLKCFLTPKGSHPLRRQEGTEFAYLIGGNIVDIGAMESSIMQYIDDACDQLRSSDALNPLLTPEERLRDVNLIKFNQIDSQRIEFWVEIINAAGTSVNALIPYATS